ncbi:hypothetical protein IQ22_01074 [Pseudomonas duriflava]|uniref:Uncharacterized protein n=1 Tax=Pseudomonas duriflava TaxID=459528 RepID=A0A562QIN9_9PSED|nr:hypothetical protein [Pseudomonas duriflava]TWI56622.1 hypothetical protein IQ22_01074 [Pseudomonas duriflava]
MLSRMIHAIRRLIEADRQERTAAEKELARVEDPEGLRHELRERNRRLLTWLGALSLGGLLFGLMIGRLYHDEGRPGVPVTPQVSIRQAVETTDGISGQRVFRLVLNLNQPVRYERYQPEGGLSLRLPAITLVGGERSGTVRSATGGSLSWSVRQEGRDVTVLVVRLGDEQAVQDQLKKQGDTWLLRIEAPLP